MPDIRHSLQISAAPDAIRPLVSTADGLARWWAEDVSERDGAVELGFFNRNTVYRLKAGDSQSDHQFEWQCESGREWAGTRIAFNLQAAGDGTLLRFTHAGWADETAYFTSCNTVWGELMFRLKAAAEGNPRGPLFLKASLAY